MEIKMSFAYGLDVSIWNKKVDWVKIQQQGFSFVFVKASQADWEDQAFKQSWAGAKEAGLLRGAYHFFVEDVDPHKQAQVFINLLRDDPGELPPVVDAEHNRRWDDAAKAIITLPIRNRIKFARNLQAMLSDIETQLNRKPMVYTGGGFWNGEMNIGGAFPAWAPGYELWVANYITLPFMAGSTLTAQNIQTVVSDIEAGQYIRFPWMPGSWKKWKFWQFSGDAYFLDGLETITDDERVVKARIDLNVFAGSLGDLLSWANVEKKVIPPDDDHEPIDPVKPDDQTGTPKPPVLNITNQQMINAYWKAFGNDAYWNIILRVGLAEMANHRNEPYTGLAIDDLPLTAAEKAALKKAVNN
jgi:GH25 family lysozyme M1 (1,4-beta-N-acetylmuramidase)